MISKRIGITPKNDDYARLAAYIADAGHEGEKALMSWCAGCLGGDEYTEGIAEVLDTQDKNTRSVKTKTYHLVVSFRPEDEAKLTPEAFKAMEERFAVALGWSEHQRHCGVHKNTANLHMHIAYNMVNSENYTLYKEFRDFWIRDKVCRELEKEYGFALDNGRNKDAQRSLGEKAALIEAHTGQQSFESYAKGQRDNILHVLETATDWQAFHEGLARYGMAAKARSGGLVMVDRHNRKHTVKASAVDRSLSFKKLEGKLGSYIPAQGLEKLPEHSRYQQVPLHRSPERGALYAEFLQGIEKRKTALAAVKDQEDVALAAVREKWAVKRRELECKNIAKKNLRRLVQVAKKHETEALAKARLAFQEPRESLRREVPYTSWNGFLQHKAEQGNETALAVLRSIQETIDLEQESPVAPKKDWSQHGKEQFQGTTAKLKAEYAPKERAILENTDLTGKGKTHLLAVLRMEQLADEERLQKDTGQNSTLIAGFRHTVDRKGTVVFTLPGGGTIRDSGKDLFFTAGDKAAEAAAKCYAQKKWGKSIRLEGNHICREPGRDSELENVKKTPRHGAVISATQERPQYRRRSG